MGTNNLPLGKPMGRPPGSANRLSLEARQTLINLGFNPLEEMVKRFLDPKSSDATKDKMVSELVQYFVPKLKAIEHSGDHTAALESLVRVVFQQKEPKIDTD